MSLPPELAAHLGRAVTSVCHCWRLTRADGQVTGYTDHDRTITLEGLVFQPQSGLTASEARSSLGLSVDTVDVEGALSSDGIRDIDIAGGLYDDASVETFLVNWRAPEQFALLRKAIIGKITRSDGRFVAELKSPTHALDQPRGRYVARACDAELGDQRCRANLDPPQFTGSGAVVVQVPPDILNVTGLNAFTPAWFAGGVLTWTAGARAGRSDRVLDNRREGAHTVLSLGVRDGPAVAEGDTFVIRAGCDKAFVTCKAKFGNAVNFRGFPHLPGNDAGYAYVSEGGVFDGRPVVP